MSCPSSANSDGSITAIVENGVAPYTYRWNTGETTATITGKPRGTYTVTVTDSEGVVKSRSFYMGYAAQWTDLSNIEVGADGSLVKTGAAAWNSGASAYNQLDANQDGWMEFTAGAPGSNYMFGLSDRNVDVDYKTIDYAVYIQSSGRMNVYEGVSRNQFGYAREGDVFRISREGNVIRYYRNGRQFREVAALKGPLQLDASILAGALPFTTASFGGIRIEDQITYPKYGASDGAIVATGVGGKAPYAL